MWDFPRMQIATLAAISSAMYGRLFFRRRPSEVAMLGASGAVIAYQLYRIHTYTPFISPTVQRVDVKEAADTDNRIVLMMTNVLMENDQHDRLLQVIEAADPDVILAVEVDDAWMRALDALSEKYPHSVRQPQDNYYGMVLFSRLALEGPQVEFLVQDDIPSIHTWVKLRSGVRVKLHGIHPRPPEPIRDQPSSPRDAELVLVGRQVEKENEEPTIVAGDLNDVAWSSTSELFVRLSGLLDPRAGRGLFNTYNANNPILRYPLDHVFHSKHFKLGRLVRLPKIGSDHFPILIDLHYVPSARTEQAESQTKPGDEELADEKLEREAEDAATGADRPRE